MATDRTLKPSTDYGRMAGFRNMLRKENARWWKPMSVAVQLVVWLVILNALVAVMLFIVPNMVTVAVNQTNVTGMPAESQEELAMYSSQHDVANMGMSLFFQLAGFAVFIGAVIFGHDAILKERESGTAAWLLSKPVSRTAFVLSKLVAAGIGVMIIVLLAQGIIAYAMSSVEQGSPMPVLQFLAGLSVLGLSVLFSLTLAIALGAFTLSRGIALGVPLIIGITGGMILSIFQMVGIPHEVEYFVPWNLTGYAASLATGAALPDGAVFPIIATIVWILVFAGAAIWRFEKLEL